MSFTSKQMAPIDRRYTARRLRASMTTLGRSIDEAAAKHNISRPTAYRILEELRVWEDAATLDQEIAEVEEQFKAFGGIATLKRKNLFHVVMSGKWLMSYINGDDLTISINPPTDSLLD